VNASGIPAAPRLAVVLVDPWEPGNVGAVARAMNNLDVEDLRLVVQDPAGVPRLLGEEARRRATHGAALLDAARIHPCLEEAVADCAASFGFTARTGRGRAPRQDLFTAARVIASSPPAERTALVFGTEERGLARRHLEHCTDLVRIPAPGPHPVLNLAQAVLVALWEVTAVRLDPVRSASAPGPPARERDRPRARLEDRQVLREDWDRLLDELGYGRRGRGTLHDRILRRLLALFDRGGGLRDDAAMLRGLARAARRALRTGDGDQREI
jgi:tRNA/rRNA methyltransferase